MKHIGWCLDQIQIAMMPMPKEVISPEDKVKANDILDKIEEYLKTLAELILNPGFKEKIHQLENASSEGARLQAHEIEELLKDLEHMLYILELYITNLRDIIINHPEQWHNKAKDLCQMISQKFCDEWGELQEKFRIAVHSEEELRQLITSEKHLAEFVGN
ncbi:MAG: hypothetical protein KKG75_05220 [Nanoarchaeota archaeon]|nr:hypothetical protein [Nanoarchaeota archaeon]